MNCYVDFAVAQLLWGPTRNWAPVLAFELPVAGEVAPSKGQVKNPRHHLFRHPSSTLIQHYKSKHKFDMFKKHNWSHLEEPAL